MITSSIILDINNRYVGKNGQLPSRPGFDKAFLTNLVSKNLVSKAGFDLLPKSIRSKAVITHGEPELPLTIPEIDGLTDMLIVIRSYIDLGKGKKFRLDRFKRIAKSGQIEIWFRRTDG